MRRDEWREVVVTSINLLSICSSRVWSSCPTFGLSFSLGLRMDSVKKEEASPNMETPPTGFWMV